MRLKALVRVLPQALRDVARIQPGPIERLKCEVDRAKAMRVIRSRRSASNSHRAYDWRNGAALRQGSGAAAAAYLRSRRTTSGNDQTNRKRSHRNMKPHELTLAVPTHGVDEPDRAAFPKRACAFAGARARARLGRTDGYPAGRERQRNDGRETCCSRCAVRSRRLRPSTRDAVIETLTEAMQVTRAWRTCGGCGQRVELQMMDATAAVNAAKALMEQAEGRPGVAPRAHRTQPSPSPTHGYAKSTSTCTPGRGSHRQATSRPLRDAVLASRGEETRTVQPARAPRDETDRA